MVNAAIAPSNIVGRHLDRLTNKPAGSLAAFMTSPLGDNVPLYNTSDRYTGERSTPAYQLAGRAFFRPDVVGTLHRQCHHYHGGQRFDQSGQSRSRRELISAFRPAPAVTAGERFYGSPVPSIYPTYTNTPHASIFTRAIDGLVSSHYSKSCIACHTVGYDTNSFAVNGGFDDHGAAKRLDVSVRVDQATGQLGRYAVRGCKIWPTSSAKTATAPAASTCIRKAWWATPTPFPSTTRRATARNAMTDLTSHFKSAEWNNSLHAAASRTPSGANRPQCVRCHTAPGFVGWATAGGMALQNQYPTNIICGELLFHQYPGLYRP